ncbi:hypothetical protein HCJ46_11640 [Listeria booriae]|uniref:hypothetical protein n=1 Tax=Listeria booriae TaxID=1552123 RepID=UPI0016251907|nr:hypothetical protein [Listeria booriae]MBC1919394.1 hypothetical protein [Listeria booriae]
MEIEQFNKIFENAVNEAKIRFQKDNFYKRIEDFSSNGNLTPEEGIALAVCESVDYTNELVYRVLKEVLFENK